MNPENIPSFPFPSDQINPPAEYAERRGGCPLGKVRLASGHEARLLVTHRDVTAALTDRRFSHNLAAPGSARLTAGLSVFDDPNSLLNKDGHEHVRVRKIVASAFSPRRVQYWKPAIERVAVDLLDAMEATGAPADLVEDFCVPLPTRIICKLLGIPERDAASFREWSNAVSSAARMPFDEQIRKMIEFGRYTAQLVAERRARPGSDLIDELIAAQDGDDRLSEKELVHLVVGLIAAGNETTSNSLSRYVIALLGDDHGLWQQLVADPDLVPAAVDELLRHTVLGTTTTLRVATEDIELPSGAVHAGEVVAIAAVSAQRDESVYEDPDRISFHRPKVPTLAFGGGAHRCLGANLAVAELQISLRLLVERFPNLQITENVAAIEFTDGEILSSPVKLPVVW